MVMPSKMEMGIPESGMPVVTEMAEAVEKPAKAVAYDRARPGMILLLLLLVVVLELLLLTTATAAASFSFSLVEESSS
jgi:hypothetical protein